MARAQRAFTRCVASRLTPNSVSGVVNNSTVHIVLDRNGDGDVVAHPDGESAAIIGQGDLADFVRDRERAASTVRWVWSDTAAWYPELLAAGVRVARCTDLRLCHAILRNSPTTAQSDLAKAPANSWDHPSEIEAASTEDALFEIGTTLTEWASAVDEFRRQQDAVAGSTAPDTLRLLLAAECAGALIAAEMHYAGVPFSAQRHTDFLTHTLGERVLGGRPRTMEKIADDVRALLHSPDLNLDSPADLLRALNRADVRVTSTRAWELREINHPVVEPLLRYKKLARLYTANGWNWLETWVSGGRFRPDYVPGGVVTGRWSARGGGALQLPKQVRAAVVADPGWKLVVADAAQLEPRILSGLSRDLAMSKAGSGSDLYAGIVNQGVLDDRAHAKIAMLGAMYGATTGDAGRLMPRLTRAFPRAIAFVEAAARTGERGGIVSSALGRGSVSPSENWKAAQAAARAFDATDGVQRRALSLAREWGRFTRNFVVQATAAEWALCWMAELRTRLSSLASQSDLTSGPHLVYFLHDEVIVHSPAERADEVQVAIEQSAVIAGRLIFGRFPVDFPVSISIVDDYSQAEKNSVGDESDETFDDPQGLPRGVDHNPVV